MVIYFSPSRSDTFVSLFWLVQKRFRISTKTVRQGLTVAPIVKSYFSDAQLQRSLDSGWLSLISLNVLQLMGLLSFTKAVASLGVNWYKSIH